LEIPVFTDTFIDFQYNTTLAFRGESRSAVLINGRIFDRVQKSVIDSAINRLEARCGLNDRTEPQILSLIRLNHSLQTLYQHTALGIVKSLEDIPLGYLDIANEIASKYTPEATKSCKNQYNFQETISKTLESFTNGTFGIQNAWKDWKE
jgi:hypothetical protein